MYPIWNAKGTDIMIKADNLKDKIEECGFTVKEFAAKMNLSCSAFYKRISGKREFKISEIFRMAELLSLTSSEVEAYFFEYEVPVLETETDII